MTDTTDLVGRLRGGGWHRIKNGRNVCDDAPLGAAAEITRLQRECAALRGMAHGDIGAHDPAEAALVLLDRVAYDASSAMLEAMQRILPTEQTADLFAAFNATLTALAGAAK